MIEINRELIGKRLKERREAANLTLEQVAEKIGKTFPTVAKYESGEIKNIDVMVINTIANITNTNIDYFLLKSNMPDKQTLIQNYPNSKKRTVKIPILGYIRAGVPLDAIEENVGDYLISEEKAKTGNFFALKVKR